MTSVVVSSAGVVSPAGVGLGPLFEQIAAGMPGTGEIGQFDTSCFPCRVGGEVKDAGLRQPGDSSLDRKSVFLRMALEQVAASGVLEGRKPEDCLFVLGAGLDYFDLPNFIEKGGAWQQYSHNTVDLARRLAAEYRLSPEVVVNVTACVAGSQALGHAYRRLKKDGAGKLAICGGVDSMLNPLHYMGFYKLGALSTGDGPAAEACRPFDRRRCGLVLGEGAALYALERASDADPERILAEIAGYSSTMDAFMVTDPEPSGSYLAAAAREAIAEAGLTADEIDCVHLHGTGTRKNELAEAAAMKLIFGERYRDVPVYSMKGQIGHLIAACGALELSGVIFSLQTQSVPPTVNFREPDPEVPLRVVSRRPLPLRIRNVLKLNAAFGGQNTALVVRRHEA